MALTQEHDALLHEIRLLLYSFETSLFATLISEPTQEEIDDEVQKNRSRDYDEVVACIRFRKAIAMRKVKNELNS